MRVRTTAAGRRQVLLSLGCYLASGGWPAYAESASPAPLQDVIRRNEFGFLGVSLQYGYELLDAAMERSVSHYGPYKIEPVMTEMSVARLHREVVKGDLVNVVVRAPGSREMEEGLIPIDIPLDKGLNGYRVAFIRLGDQSRIERLGDIAGLRQMRIGIGEQWLDVPIYKHNNIPLVAAREYDSLLGMLQHGRFDLFPRPASAVLSEYNVYKAQYPSIEIDQHLLIRYPLGMYAFVSKSTPRLAERIRYGLHEMQKDGSFDRYFDQHFSQVIAKLKFPQRTLIELENPLLPAWANASPIELR